MIDLSLLHRRRGGLAGRQRARRATWCSRPGSGWRGTSRGHVFQGRNSETEREEILGDRGGRRPGDRCCSAGPRRFRLDRLDRIDRQLLHERHLVSKELAGLDPDGRVRLGASVLVQDRIGVMLNEEDHLRIQGLHSGFALDGRRTPRWTGWTPNWDNDLLSHFTRSSVILPPVRPTSGPGSAPRC